MTLFFVPCSLEVLGRDSNPPDLIGSLQISCVASRSLNSYQILLIYQEILKTREKC